MPGRASGIIIAGTNPGARSKVLGPNPLGTKNPPPRVQLAGRNPYRRAVADTSGGPLKFSPSFINPNFPDGLLVDPEDLPVLR